jgi:hypothetical protein
VTSEKKAMLLSILCSNGGTRISGACRSPSFGAEKRFDNPMPPGLLTAGLGIETEMVTEGA